MSIVAGGQDNPGSLRGRIASGVAWGVYISVMMQVTRTVVALVLVRLLTPDEYGLAAMAFVISAFVLTLSDASLGKALVQRPMIDELDRSTVFWATVAIGAILSVGGFLAAGPISALFHEPRVEPLVAVLSITFVLQSAQMTHVALLQRYFAYRATAVRFTLGVLVAGAVGIAAAALGAGAWALIAQQIAFAATSTLALWFLSPWRPQFLFSWARLRSLGGFGANVMGSRLLNDVSSNAHTLFIGRFLGSQALGIYSVAYNLITLPIARLVVPIQDSLFPAYSRIQADKARVAAIWTRTTAVVLAVLAPAMLGLAIVSGDFVRLVFGSKWAAVGPLIAILAPVAILQALASLAATVLLAIDRSTTVFRWSVASMVLIVGACVFGLQWGTKGVAVSFAAVFVPLAGAITWSAARELGLRASEVGGVLRGPFEATAAMAAVLMVSEWMLAGHAGPGARLAALILIGGLVYLPLCVLRVEPVRSELARLRRSRPRISGAPSVSPAD